MDKIIENLNYKNVLTQAINHAKSIGITSLDFTDGSIGDVEAILSFYHENIHKLNEDSITNLSIFYGVYIGEVMLKNYLSAKDFNWYYDIDIHIIKSDEAQISPITKVYNRLKNGEVDNVLNFYHAIIDYVIENKINENVNRHINIEFNSNLYEAINLDKVDTFIEEFTNHNSCIKFISHDGYLMIINNNQSFNFEVNIKEETLVSKNITIEQIYEIVSTYYCKITEELFLKEVQQYLLQSEILT